MTSLNWAGLFLSAVFLSFLFMGNVQAKDNTKVTISRTRLERLQHKLMLIEEKLTTLALNSPLSETTATLPRSCFEALTSNPSMESGIYEIDPDGSNVGDDPIAVFCNATTGTTSISHDTEEKTITDACDGPGCYEKQVNYVATVKQMRALIDISKQCRQSIEVECMTAPFEYDQIQYSYWKDVNGSPQYFWAGDKSAQHTCQCGIDGNCQIDGSATPLPNVKCKCDYNSSSPQIDIGFITDKEYLPVKSLLFGKYQRRNSNSWHVLGKLECSGKEEVTKGKMPTSCEDLALIGHSLNGFFSVQGSGKKIIEIVYCNFNLSPNAPGFEERQGFAEVYEELDDEPLNCEELKLNGHTVNGLYSVQGTGKKAMETAYCNFDLTSDTSEFEERLGFVQMFNEVQSDPTSCNDQQQNGHSANGFYLVKPILKKNKIEVIYCNFDLEPNTEGYEKRFGFAQTRSNRKGVSFYVQNINDYAENNRIKFDIPRINNGRDIKLRTGIFTAAVPGRYFFSFVGVKEDRDGHRGSNEHMVVSLRKNGVIQGYAAGASYKSSPPPKCRSIRSCAQKKNYDKIQPDTRLFNEFDYTFSIQGVFDLKVGETVDVFLHEGEVKGSAVMELKNARPYNHFIGFLLDEDVIF